MARPDQRIATALANDSEWVPTHFLSYYGAEKAPGKRKGGAASAGFKEPEMNRIEDLVAGLVAPMLDGNGMELVGVEFVKERGQYYLRVYIDKPEGGVGLDDCEKVSHFLSDELDRVDPIPQRYYLEVASPGLERPLTKAADYQRFTGSGVEVRIYAPVDGSKRFLGTLQGLEDGKVRLTLKNGGREVSIPLDAISRAKLTVEDLPVRGGNKR